MGRKRGPIRRTWQALARRITAAPRGEVSAVLSLLRPRKIGTNLRRLGPSHDGGYLVPDDLSGIVGCVSPGVSSECGFDIDVADLGIPVLLADASVDGPPLAHANFTFVKTFVDIAGAARSQRMATLAGMLPAPGDLMLQMDIEGAEYRVLPDMDAALRQRFRVMVIEFHALHKMLRRGRITAFRRLLEDLDATHLVAHLHINNVIEPVRVAGYDVPPLVEITYWRRDRAGALPPGKVALPHPLDGENRAGCGQVRYPSWLDSVA